jgi:DNA-binding beta-propeller fold protein YncE
MSRYVAIPSLCLLGVTACAGSSDITEQSAAAIADTSAVDVPAYERDPFWPPALPDGWVMGTPTSLYVDPRDHVWVLHRPRTAAEGASAAPPVIEFDENGAFVQAWGGPDSGYDWPDTEHGIYVDHENNVWVTGINPRAGAMVSERSDDMLLKFNQNGELIFQLGGRSVSGGNADTSGPRQAADVAVLGDEAFVADGYGNRRVWVIDAHTGEHKRQWGAFGNEPEDAIEVGLAAPPPPDPNAPLETEGDGPDQFGVVHGIGVSDDGLVYVADRNNRRIQVFTIDGEFVTQKFVNREGPAAAGVARIVFSSDIDQRLIYANDFGNGRVWILDRETLETVGEIGESGSAPGQFGPLHHIGIDSRNVIYTAEVGANGRVQKFIAWRQTSTMTNTHRMVENWPTLNEGMSWGAAIGMIPDDTGGTWMMIRSEPPVSYVNADGVIEKSFADGVIDTAHGFCMDGDGNIWAGDSGPFRATPESEGRGFQLHKFSPDGELLLSLGQSGVSAAGENTFIGPTSCALAPNGNLIVADGHWPRPASAQQDGDRLVEITTDGEFVRQVGRLGSNPGEFMGPHAVAFDSQGRLFVADRSNNRIQVLDQNLKFLDEWRHFGRPSGITILDDDTIIVADSESSLAVTGPPQAPEGGGRMIRNPGWQVGIRIGSARDGSLRQFIPGPRPEGMAADNLGNIFAGLTSNCGASPSGGCLQKFVPR